MNWTARIRTWLHSVTRREQVERDMQTEIRFHLEQYADDLAKSGYGSYLRTLLTLR